MLIDVIGEDKIILGSDYPFPLGELDVGKLIETSKHDERIKVRFIGFFFGGHIKMLIILILSQKEKLLYKNGMKFIGIDA